MARGAWKKGHRTDTHTLPTSSPHMEISHAFWHNIQNNFLVLHLLTSFLICFYKSLELRKKDEQGLGRSQRSKEALYYCLLKHDISSESCFYCNVDYENGRENRSQSCCDISVCAKPPS